MSLKEDLEKDINDIVNNLWTTRDGQVVPKVEDLGLKNDGVKLQATMLYSDLVHSTKLVTDEIQTFASEIYKLFLSTSARIIKYHDGFIRSFDGDRVMGVFIGTAKNTNAVGAALDISHAVTDMIVPKIKTFYSRPYFNIEHCTGIDTSEVFVIRGGPKIDNDLVWIGRAANAAAKLSDVRDGYTTVISEDVYDHMNDMRKYLNDTEDGHVRKYIWVSKDWNEIKGINKIYRTHWRKIIQ
mgnify:CR=1 FL=1